MTLLAQTLYSISVYLSLSDNLEDDVWALVVSETATSVEGDGCSLFLLEDGVLKLKAPPGFKVKEEEKGAFYRPGEGLTGWVGATGKTLRVLDTHDVERFHQIDPKLDWKSKYSEDVDLDRFPENPFLAVPIIVNEEIVGVLRVIMKKSGVAFSESDEEILRGIAAQIGAAIHRKDLDNQVHRLLDRLKKDRQHLASAIRAIGSSGQTVNEVLKRILQSAKSCTGAILGDIRFYNKDTDTLDYVMVIPEDKWDEMDQSITSAQRGASIGAEVLHTQQPYVCPDVSQDPLWSRCFSEAKSCVVVPLTFGTEKIGVLCADSPEVNAFDDNDKEILSLLGVQAAVAIKNARIIEELRKAGEEKDAYMLDVAHQLVAPLQGVRGNAENLLEGRYRDEQYEIILENLLESSNRCARMAKNFSYLPDDRKGQGDLRPRRQRVTPLLIASARNCQGLAKTKKIYISVDDQSTDSLPDLNLDAELFMQAASNVIDNGVKYSNLGSTVTISAERKDKEAFLYLENYGIPIREGEEEKIFERRFRTTEAKRREPTSVGVGLTVARDIVERHGGTITAQPSTKIQKRFKTVFTITLPIP